MIETTRQKELKSILEDARAAVVTRAAYEWEEAGGCSSCLGWGGSIWGRFCPRVNDLEAHRRGPKPGSVSPNGVHAAAPLPTSEESSLIEEIERMIFDLDSELATLNDELTIKKGSRVVVVKGTKIPLGSTGQVFWIGTVDAHPEWGTRVGINFDDGTSEWTSLVNVEIDI